MVPIEIVLVFLAIILIVFGLVLFVATMFAFFGAMSFPEDLNDDVLGDKYERD